MDLSMTIDGKDIRLHYFWQGSGEKVLFTFHGFGQNGLSMHPLSEALGHAYRICHVDIFYHGRSYWNESLGPVTKSHWKQIMEKLLQEETIGRFDMAAFSMGGKFLLCTLEIFPERTDRIILIAPDGIRTSTWYSLASYPVVFRSYFRSMIVKPWRFYTLVRWLQRLRLLDRGIAKFASTQMDTRRKRRRVYFSWVMFRQLRFNLKKIAGLINRHQIDCEFYLGIHDRIITENGMKRLTRYLTDHQMYVLKTGHNQLISAAAEALHEKK